MFGKIKVRLFYQGDKKQINDIMIYFNYRKG